MVDADTKVDIAKELTPFSCVMDLHRVPEDAECLNNSVPMTT